MIDILILTGAVYIALFIGYKVGKVVGHAEGFENCYRMINNENDTPDFDLPAQKST